LIVRAAGLKAICDAGIRPPAGFSRSVLRNRIGSVGASPLFSRVMGTSTDCPDFSTPGTLRKGAEPGSCCAARPGLPETRKETARLLISSA